MTPPARVLLVRHAPTATTRRHAFPVDEPLDARGERQAVAMLGRLRGDRAVCSPAARCRQTAVAAGFPEPSVDARWAEIDFGRWAGRTFDEVLTEDPDELAAWLEDPARAPGGGETLTALGDRVTAALEELREDGRTTVVVTSGGPIKVAVLSALGAPLANLWHLDVAPCSVTTLHARPAGGWTLRTINEPAAVAVPA